MPLSQNTPAAAREKARQCHIATLKDAELLHIIKTTHQSFTTLDQPRPVAGSGTIETNLTLMDGQQPIFQQISLTSAEQHSAAIKSAKDGLKAFKLLSSLKKPTDTQGKYHLGFWHSTGNSYLGMTKDTLRKKKEDPKAALPLLKWAKKHSIAFLSPILPLIHPDFQQAIDDRRPGRKWLEDHFKNAAEYTHPWWTTVTFFDDFTGSDHVDARDDEPSFLFNFGKPCIIRLHDYKVDIQLDPFDIAIFNTRSIHHSTHGLEGEEDDGLERWAFSAFFRTSIKNMIPVSQVGEKREAKIGEGPGPSKKRVKYTY